MTDTEVLESLLAAWVEKQLSGEQPLSIEELCHDRPELAPRLRELVARFVALEQSLSGRVPAPAEVGEVALPSFPGFRTIERLGRGGSGEVYKLEDLTLGRVVAGKVLRAASPLATGAADFLREARSLALFEDPRVVRLLEFRPTDPPLLLMEYVDGFPLSQIGPSLEYTQRARLLAEVADALQGAHELGIQHRDLKPAHVLVDAALRPHLLDFGLSQGAPHGGHGLGTLAYMAPEQLDPAAPMDARTDVYALGVMLYELVTGRLPYTAGNDAALLDAIRRGEPDLPAEHAPSVPEPLQAIALQAMACNPAHRYTTRQGDGRRPATLRRRTPGAGPSCRLSLRLGTTHGAPSRGHRRVGTTASSSTPTRASDCARPTSA